MFSVHISDCLSAGDEDGGKDETVLEVLTRENPDLAKALKEAPLSWLSEVMYLGEDDDYTAAHTKFSTLAIGTGGIHVDGNICALPR